LGYRGQDPGWGGILGSTYTDITNQFILVAVESGLIGLLVFCGLLIILFRAIAAIYNKLHDPVLKTWYWTLGSIIFATIITWFSVSFFGSAMSLFYCVLGMIGSSICFITNESRNFQRIEILPQRFKV
jgi:O-antigen ligase